MVVTGISAVQSALSSSGASTGCSFPCEPFLPWSQGVEVLVGAASVWCTGLFPIGSVDGTVANRETKERMEHCVARRDQLHTG